MHTFRKGNRIADCLVGLGHSLEIGLHLLLGVPASCGAILNKDLRGVCFPRRLLTSPLSLSEESFSSSSHVDINAFFLSQRTRRAARRKTNFNGVATNFYLFKEKIRKKTFYFERIGPLKIRLDSGA